MPSLGPESGFKNTPQSEHLIWGPWRMPAVLGVIVNIIACIFATIILAFSCFPPVAAVTPETMNYSSVVTGGIAIFALLYYIVRARKFYKGPLIEFSEE